jgi:hypothetical protein
VWLLPHPLADEMAEMQDGEKRALRVDGEEKECRIFCLDLDLPMPASKRDQQYKRCS